MVLGFLVTIFNFDVAKAPQTKKSGLRGGPINQEPFFVQPEPDEVDCSNLKKMPDSKSYSINYNYMLEKYKKSFQHLRDWAFRNINYHNGKQDPYKFLSPFLAKSDRIINFFKDRMESHFDNNSVKIPAIPKLADFPLASDGIGNYTPDAMLANAEHNALDAYFSWKVFQYLEKRKLNGFEEDLKLQSCPSEVSQINIDQRILFYALKDSPANIEDFRAFLGKMDESKTEFLKNTESICMEFQKNRDRDKKLLDEYWTKKRIESKEEKEKTAKELFRKRIIVSSISFLLGGGCWALSKFFATRKSLSERRKKFIARGLFLGGSLCLILCAINTAGMFFHDAK